MAVPMVAAMSAGIGLSLKMLSHSTLTMKVAAMPPAPAAMTLRVGAALGWVASRRLRALRREMQETPQ